MTDNHVHKLAYGVKSAAEVLDCSPRKVNELISNNMLPAFTMASKADGQDVKRAKRYIRHQDLMAYIDYCADNQAA